MKTDQQLRTEIEALAAKKGMKIRLKTESSFMKLLGALLFFNKAFMVRYTTVIGSTVYFPSQEWMDADGSRVWRVLCHELTHWEDNKRLWLLFPLMYLSPQILALGAIGAVWNLWFLLFLLCLAPLPSPGRKWIEMRGYAISMAVGTWRYGQINETVMEHYVSQFTTAKYYFIWPFPKSVRAELEKWRERIDGGTISAHIPMAAAYQEIIKG